GASLSAILTPLVVQALVTDEPGTWRLPYVVIGFIGLFWIVPWLGYTSRVNIDGSSRSSNLDIGKLIEPATPLMKNIRRYLTLVVVVVAINMTWHFFRAWLPKMLQE